MELEKSQENKAIFTCGVADVIYTLTKGQQVLTFWKSDTKMLKNVIELFPD